MKKLMDFLRNKIAALKIFENRRIFFLVPLVVVLVMLICGTVYQLSPNYDKFANIGVDFQGGTLLNVKMESKDPNVEVDMNTVNRDYNVEIIRRVLANHGFGNRDFPSERQQRTCNSLFICSVRQRSHQTGN